MNQVNKTGEYVKCMTEEKLKWRQTSPIIPNFNLHHQFVIKRIYHTWISFAKKIQATDGLKHGRLNSKRRKTILRENDIFDILKKFESLTRSEKIASLQFHLLEIGTLTKKNLSPEYFNCLPPLTEIETEQTVPPICINFSSFLDDTVCSVPDLEEIPNPDSTDYPSFLGQNYENRDCTRVLRSNVSKSSFHPLHSL